MFIGRKQELNWLEDQYQSGKFEMSIIYGRRRVGKTTLISEFIKDKKAIFFLATQASAETNLEFFSSEVLRVLQPDLPPTSFRSFDDAFTFISDRAKDERLILVIDEYPYLADAVQGFSSLLQRAIDLSFKSSNLFLILSGSSIRFMQEKVLGEKSPLYGRKTAQYLIEPFTFGETLHYLDKMDFESAAVLYGATGGVAEYLSFINQEQSLDKNLINLFFVRRGRLFDEPTNYLYQELHNPSLYHEIFYAVAQGKTKNNQISTSVNKTSAEITYPLKNLQELGIITKLQSVGKQGSNKPIYQLTDTMFRFWYRFVYPGQSDIVIDHGEAYYENMVQPQLSDFMGKIFEKISLEFMQYLHQTKQLPEYIIEQGNWWGTSPIKKAELEFDYLGLGQQTTLIGEAKWTNERMNQSQLEELIDNSLFLSGKRYYYLFSKSGFTTGLVNTVSENQHIFLYPFSEMAKLLKEYSE